ncbi:MAG: peptidoglycan-binding domain-containing protein [Syntrophales bacterium]|nr:peptidoglycan-binding domain-containing protein [Syntrophales bacterium]
MVSDEKIYRYPSIMSVIKAKTLSGMVVGLTIIFSLVVGTGAASPLTAADIDLLFSLGLISQEKAAAAKANLGRPSPVSRPSAATKGDLFTKDIKVGSKGADVTALQNLLGVSPATGHFGALTKAAVIKYQNNKGISPATGYVGAKTRASLNAAGGSVLRP